MYVNVFCTSCIDPNYCFQNVLISWLRSRETEDIEYRITANCLNGLCSIESITCYMEVHINVTLLIHNKGILNQHILWHQIALRCKISFVLFLVVVIVMGVNLSRSRLFGTRRILEPNIDEVCLI